MNRGYWARCDQRGSWMVKRLFYRHCVKIRSDSSSQLYLPRRESCAHSFPAFCTLSIPSSGPRHHDASPFHCKTPHLKFNHTFVQIPLQLLGGCTFPNFSGPRSKSIKDPAHTQCRIDQPGARNTVSRKMHLYQGHAWSWMHVYCPARSNISCTMKKTIQCKQRCISRWDFAFCLF